MEEGNPFNVDQYKMAMSIISPSSSNKTKTKSKRNNIKPRRPKGKLILFLRNII